LKKSSAASINKILRSIFALDSLGIIILVFTTLTNTAAYAQLENILGLKITSHEQGQEVPVGELTISGTSTDNSTSDCIVYADVNDMKPFQKAIATGPGGVNDYSTWNFTYTSSYHLITNGTNELTAKLSCVSSPTNLTKWNSVIVVGVINDTAIPDSSTTLSNNSAVPLPENNAAPFTFPLPSENILPPTSSETEEAIDEDEGSTDAD
jgi:hypothetical protein